MPLRAGFFGLGFLRGPVGDIDREFLGAGEAVAARSLVEGLADEAECDGEVAGRDPCRLDSSGFGACVHPIDRQRFRQVGDRCRRCDLNPHLPVDDIAQRRLEPAGPRVRVSPNDDCRALHALRRADLLQPVLDQAGVGLLELADMRPLVVQELGATKYIPAVGTSRANSVIRA